VPRFCPARTACLIADYLDRKQLAIDLILKGIPFETFVEALKTQVFEGSLWIVEEGRIRVFQPPE